MRPTAMTWRHQTPALSATFLGRTPRSGVRSILGEEAVEDLQKGIDDGLAERIGASCHFLVALIASSEREVAALVRDNGFRPLDRPLREVSAAGDSHRFDLIAHSRFLSRFRAGSCRAVCIASAHAAHRRRDQPYRIFAPKQIAALKNGAAQHTFHLSGSHSSSHAILRRWQRSSSQVVSRDRSPVHLLPHRAFSMGRWRGGYRPAAFARLTRKRSRRRW